MNDDLVILTNCKNIEHRPLRETLRYGVEWVCDRCSRNGFFFRQDYHQVDFDGWEVVEP